LDRDSIWKKATSVWTHTAREIAALSDRIDPIQFESVLRLIVECRGRIVTTGTGTSGAAAKKVAHTLSCVERPALFLSPADAVHGGLGVVQPGDVVILFSKGGNTHEIVSLLPSLKMKDCQTVAVTENSESVLATQANVALRVFVAGEPDPFNMLATSSTSAVIALFDALAICAMEVTGYTREQFGIIHPGGAVGKRLLGDKK